MRVSLLPYKMATDFRHVITFLVPRPAIKPVYITKHSY